VVATHGQIDMVFWLPGSVLWAWLVLASAPAPRTATPRPPSRIACVAWASIAAATALVLAAWISPALTRQDDIAIAAADRVYAATRTQSREAVAGARSSAAQALAAASVSFPRRRSLALCASEQWIAAARDTEDRAVEAQLLESAMETASLASDAPWSRFAALRLASLAAQESLDAAPNDRFAAMRLEKALRAVLVANPRHCDSLVRLALALSAQGRLEEARAALDAAALCNETFAADPLRQFRPGRLDDARRQVESCESQPSTRAPSTTEEKPKE
jgi:hypothetical protein